MHNIIPIVAVAGILAVVSSALAESNMNLPPHPRIALPDSQLPAVRARIEQHRWARTTFDDLKKRNERFIEGAVEIPDRPGQWSHWYACKTHGAKLRTQSPTQHVCPIDGEVFTGYPYDDVVIGRDHHALADAAYEMGLLYRITGEDKYAEPVRQILLGYAQRYRNYPLHNIHGEAKVGGGRVLSQSLDESVWLIRLAQGADCIWDTLSADEIEQLRTQLFYAAVNDVILPHQLKIHNIQCWKNSAVGLVGLLFADAQLVHNAIDSEFGYRNQLAQGVSADGMWYEGAWGYHFYTIRALMPLNEAAHFCGINLYGDELRKMFEAPLAMAMPDGRLPAFNDSNTTSVRGQTNYEIALARYGGATIARALEESNRRNLEALLVGVHPLPAIDEVTTASRNIPGTGYAILQSGTGSDATWLCLKYGPHGGGHGHPDKNSFVLYSRGKILADDPGMAPYGMPIQQQWYKTTLAHNTVLVNETSQKAATGSCLAFVANDQWAGVLADAGNAIEGGTYQRAAVMLDRDLLVFIDIVRMNDGAEHVIDVAYHPNGRWITPVEGESYTPPQKHGYMHLRDMRAIEREDAVTLQTEYEGLRSSATFAGGVATKYLIGTGVGRHSDDRVPIVIARRVGSGATFAWAVSIGEEQVEIESIAPASVRVKRGNESWSVIADPHGHDGAERLHVVKH